MREVGVEGGGGTQRVKPLSSVSKKEMKTCVVTREGALTVVFL